MSGALSFRLLPLSGDRESALSFLVSPMTSVLVMCVQISSPLLSRPSIVARRFFSEREGVSRLLVDLCSGGEGDMSLTMFPLELKTCRRARLILAGEREEREDSGT